MLNQLRDGEQKSQVRKLAQKMIGKGIKYEDMVPVKEKNQISAAHFKNFLDRNDLLKPSRKGESPLDEMVLKDYFTKDSSGQKLNMKPLKDAIDAE